MKKNDMNVESNHKQKAVKKNPWRIAFFSLVGVLLAIILFVGYRITDKREVTYRQEVEKRVKTQADPSFQLTSTKKQLNFVISHYLNEFLKDSGVSYDFYLEDQALLTGTFKLLGYPVEFYLYFDPYVMEDGNIQLKARNISLGSLQLPISYVMKQLEHGLDIPKWVEFNSEETYIIVHLDQLPLKNGLRLKADRINLVDDDIRMSVYLPIENK